MPDVDTAQSFYERVLGWTFTGTGAEFGGYRIASVRGAAAAGIGPQTGPARPAWTLYFATDDADKAATAVTSNGGTVLLPPGDVGPLGRMFIAADPSGAVFGVWQAGTHIGAGLVNEPGGITWEDLRSTEPAAAQEFYRGVFGYKMDPVPMAGDEYLVFSLPDEEAPLGGMGPMMGSPEGTPSHWLVYFAVAGTDAAVEAATAAGGTVLAPAFDSPFGRLAILTDPAGASFCVIQANPDQPQPDRAG